MSYQPSATIFEIDRPVNSSPLLTSQPRSLRKMATGTPLIYGPSLLLLLAACANGNDGPGGEGRTQGGNEDEDGSVTITGTDEVELIVVTRDYAIRGLGGNDDIFGGGGNDTIHGGDGTDTLVFANSINPITIDLRGGVDDDGYYVMAPLSETEPQDDGYEKGTKFKNFERIAGTSKDDTFYGADDADFFFLSGDGDDTLVSGKGSDTFHAGHWEHGGYDVVDYSRAEGGINVDLNDLDDDDFVTVTIDHADWRDDKIKYVEDVIESDHDDTFSGEVDIVNYFTGGAGSDLFYIDEWNHTRGSDFGFDIVTDFVVGTDKIGFWVSDAILDSYFVEGRENIGGFFGAFGVSQEIDDNVLSIKHLGVTILEIDDYSGTEVLSLDVTNFTLSLDVA